MSPGVMPINNLGIFFTLYFSSFFSFSGTGLDDERGTAHKKMKEANDGGTGGGGGQKQIKIVESFLFSVNFVLR